MVRTIPTALALAAALCCTGAFAAPTNVVQANLGTVTLPLSQGFSNSFATTGGAGYVDASGDAIDGSTITAPFKASEPAVTGVFNFYDDFTFTLPASTDGTLTASAVSVSLLNLFGINNLQVRLYAVQSGGLTTGSPASVISGWSSPVSAGGSTLTVSTFGTPIAVAAGQTYALEVRGQVVGSNGSYGGNLNISPVPEADGAALALMGLALAGVVSRQVRTKA
jgi:hypothetical protein